jgi:HAD superfamily hydrolase (TIGR01484 family)
LDGTLIPLDGCQRNVSDLRLLADELRTHEVTLVFVTGRHFESVQAAIREHCLPTPDWIICDVGTTIYQSQGNGDFARSQVYGDHLATVTTALSVDDLRSRLAVLDRLRPQEPEKQGPFKLSYYANANELDELHADINRLLIGGDAPYSLIQSVDPFNGEGLIDFLPRGVSKAYALQWWSHQERISQNGIVYAGDSGNDLAAFTAGYRTIVVGNAERSLGDHVRDAHGKAGWTNRLFIAEDAATSGVLAGCRKFRLFDP